MSGETHDKPAWLTIADANAVHALQIAQHGGGAVIRDAGLLESALARPINRWGCGDDDPATLAAAYAHGIARTRELLAIGK